jgi:hypothetical protein
MIERNRSEKVCERSPESHRYITERLLRNETVPVMEGVEQWEEWCWLVTPALD